MKSFIKYCKTAKSEFTTEGGKSAWRELIKEVLNLHINYYRK